VGRELESDLRRRGRGGIHESAANAGAAQKLAGGGPADHRRWARASKRAATGFFWKPRRHRARRHGVWAGARAAQRALRKLGAESGDGVVATAGVDEGRRWTRAD